MPYREPLSKEAFLREERAKLEREFEREIVLSFFKKWPKKKNLDAFLKTGRFASQMKQHCAGSEYYQSLCNANSREAAAAYQSYCNRKKQEARMMEKMSEADSGIGAFFEREPMAQVLAERHAMIVAIIIRKAVKRLSSGQVHVRRRVDQGGRKPVFIREGLNRKLLEEFIKDFTADDPDLSFLEGYVRRLEEAQQYGDAVISFVAETDADLKKLKASCGKNFWSVVLSRARYRVLADVDPDMLYSVLREVKAAFTETFLLDTLEQNPRYREMIQEYREKKEAERRMETMLLDEIPERYIDLYPAARSMKRRFFLHIGPTNSGKTHDAVEALQSSETGVYLAPLRLLAYEQFDSMNRNGYRCSLRTGEEKIAVPGASFVASTVEMADLSAGYETAVIDEAQMVGDVSRGGAWTAAILGLRAEKIHVCASPIAETVLSEMIRECGDELEIIRHERQTPLKMEPRPVWFPQDTLTGDAFIVFRRANVHAVASELQKKGYRVSIIYGALPYDVRHEEARKFNAGETDVVVATDAIGMGLNMPVRRIVFLEATKFDGKDHRFLLPEEVKQIAGRAGRYGLYDAGYVTGVRDIMEHIRVNMFIPSPEIEQAVIAFPEQLIGIEGKLSEIFKKWNEMAASSGYIKSDCYREIQLSEKLEEAGEEDKKVIYSFVTIPFDERDSRLFQIWRDLYDCWKNGRELKFPGYGVGEGYHRSSYSADDMAKLEEEHKVCDLLYFFAERFGYEEQANSIMSVKQDISRSIMQILSRHKLKGKKCRLCGEPIVWNSPYNVCRRCRIPASQLRN